MSEQWMEPNTGIRGVF